MARRIAAGDESGSRHAQNRAVELTLLLSVPCMVAFLLVPDLIMRALFSRGAFTAADAQAAGATLAAYAIGLLPFVLMRSATVTFLARGDTFTPVKALFVAVIVNVALKILLMDRYAQVGLALATAAGAWVNLGLLIAFAVRQKLITIDDRLRKSAASLFAGLRLREEATLLALAVLGVLVYGGAVLALFGTQWFAAFRGRRAPAAPAPREPD
jgi:putative peptidoglycan lipid II flippase